MRRGWAVLAVVVLAACAHAPPRKPIDWRPASGVTTVACNDSEPLAPGATVELLRERCGDGLSSACSALAEKTGLDAPDDVLVRKKLEPRCRADPRCGCAHLGHALLWDRSEKELLRAGDLLDASCNRGALDACDDMALYASICAASKPNPLCERLKTQHRVPPPPETEGPKELPFALQRCFVVLTTMEPLDRCSQSIDGVARIVAPAPPASSPWERGLTVCFEGDRISSKTPTGRWNQQHARWVGVPSNEAVTDATSGLRLDASSPSSVAFEMGCVEGGLFALREAWPEDARRIPRVEVVCGRMRRCIAALTKMFPRPPEGDDSPPPELPDDLLGCADFQARMTKLVPSPPAECQ